MIDQQITRQPGKPHRKRTFAGPEAFERPEHAQEDFLGQVLGLVIRAGEPVTDRVHTPGMDFDQVLPGGLLASQAPLDQLNICVQKPSQDLTRLAKSDQISGSKAIPLRRPSGWAW